MKKYSSLLFCCACGLSMTLLLSGCLPAVMVAQSETDTEVEEDKWEDAWDELDGDWSAKGHYWQVLDADGEEVCKIDGEEAVGMVDELTKGGGDWKQADSSPEDAKMLYTYVFMQQKTLLAGQDPDAEREYEEVMRFTVYEDSDVLTMVILDGMEDTLPASLSELIDLEDILTVHAEAPVDTVEALRDPQQFTK